MFSRHGHRPISDLRRDERFATYLPGTVMCAGRAVAATILDLSASGALIHRAANLHSNSIVWLSAAGVERAARVVWTRGERMGLQFVKPLETAQLQHLLEAGRYLARPAA